EDTGSIPVVDFPSGNPLLGRAGVGQPGFDGGFVLISGIADEFFVVVELAIDIEGSRVEAADAFAVDFANVTGVVVIDHHLQALAGIVGAAEQAGANAPVGLEIDRKLEVAKSAIGQQDAAVAATGRILLAGDRAIFDLPVAAGAVADFHRVFVPAG